MNTICKLLAGVEHSELMGFLQDYAEHDVAFRTALLTRFASHTEDGVIGLEVRDEIEALADDFADRAGFVCWNDAYDLAHEIGSYMEQARQEYSQRHIRNAFNILTAVAEGTLEIMARADDGGGSLGHLVDDAFGLFRELAADELPEQIRADLMDYCISSVRNGIFDGWDWHLDLLDIAVMMQHTLDEMEILKTLLTSEIKSGWQKDRAKEIFCFLELRQKSGEEQDKYIMSHIEIDNFREMAIGRAFAAKEYDKVYKLADGGVLKHKELWHTDRTKWYAWALKAAQAEGNAGKLIETAKSLFLESGSEEYYCLMKEHVPAGQWNMFVRHFAEELLEKQNLEYHYRFLCIKEQWWDRLLASVSKDGNLWTIDKYEEYLKKDHSAELIRMYAEGILSEMETSRSSGRDLYRSMCNYLKRMVSLGGQAAADEVISTLRQKYPRRRALMDELSKVY